MMRKLAVILALASTALASPALARDKAWYVGVDGGAMLVEDIHYNIGTVQNAAASDHKYGYDADGNIGYDFGPFRVEAEVAYKSAVVSGYRTSIGGAARFNSNGTYTPVNAGSYGAGGRATALSFMVNGLLDFGDSDTIQGFVGGGVGVARVKDRLALSQYGSFLNDSDTVFAYQGLAGIRAPLTPHLDATLKYRFFNAQNVRLVDVTNRAFNDRFRSHSILGGISYNFGEPPAPPPPPPVVAPPPPPPPPVETPPPPPPVCSPGPFIVFFEWNKSDITPEASSILDNAVSSYQTCNGAQVMVAGYTDRSGTAQYNVGLSQRRATAVKNYFAAHGVSDGVIQTQAFGETHPRVDTADGVREVQNRRVEITYGPGSGQ